MSMLSDFEDKVEVPEATLQEMDVLVGRVMDLREKKEEVNRELKELNEEQREVEQKILSFLNHAKMNSFAGTRATVSKKMHESVRIPASLEKKLEFFEFLKQRGVFNTLVSVNSMTLNSFCKAESEAAKDRGEFDFKIPGLDEPTLNESISVRKK